MKIIQAIKSFILKFFKFEFNTLEKSNNVGRTAFDELVYKYIKKVEGNKASLPTLSAVYRVKNAEHFLYTSVCSIAPICNEIIIIDNNSSDNTLQLAEKIKNELNKKVNVKVYSYPIDLAIAGDNYKQELKIKGSLADYYNFCFSKATSDYVMKCDAHLLYNPKSLISIQSNLSRDPKVVIFRGVELFGLRLPFERYIFKNDGGFSYDDGEFYEKLNFNYKLSKVEQFKSTIFKPVFVHYKRAFYSKMNDSITMAKQLYK